MSSNIFFIPAVRFMERLRYRAKLAVVLIFFLIPIMVLGGLLIDEISDRVNFLSQERRGVEYITVLRDLLEAIPQHRGMTNAYLSGDSDFRDKVLDKRGEIDAHFEVLTEIDRRFNNFLNTGSKVAKLKQRWVKLEDVAFELSVADAFEAHSSLIAEIIGLIRHIANTSGLVLDSELDSYYLMDAIIQRLPVLAETMGKIRGKVSGVIARKEISKKEALNITLMLSQTKNNTSALVEGMEQAFTYNNDIRINLEPSLMRVNDAIEQFIDIVEGDVLDVAEDQISITPEVLFDAGTEAITDVFLLFDSTLPVLDQLFQKRITYFISKKYLAIGIMVAVLLIILYLFAGFYYAVISSIQQLAGATQRLEKGELNCRVISNTRDELSDIAVGFNHMAETLQENSERELEQLEQLRQAADIRDRVDILLRHVKQVAAGDLRDVVKLQSDDDLGQLAIHLNKMTGSLSQIATDIRGVAGALNTTLSEVSNATSSQAASASQQASAVSDTTAALEEIKQTSSQTLEMAKQLGNIAQQTRQESKLGQDAVQEAINSIEAIRLRVDDIAQTILALSEQTQQIGEITAVVKNLAQQSKMLALNASIEAAKAGDAGKGFAVVAEEVKDLAEQSQKSTTQVQKILQDILHATDRVVMATEEGTKGVDSGVLKVQRTGEVMKTLSEVINDTAVASQQIVAAIRQEATGIDHVNIAMSDINGAVKRFAISTRQMEDANSNIMELADRLRLSVDVYKV